MERHLLDVVRSCVFEEFPPTNPGLLARAACAWYQESGADAVFKVVVSRIVEVCAIQPLDVDVYASAKDLFRDSPVVGK